MAGLQRGSRRPGASPPPTPRSPSNRLSNRLFGGSSTRRPPRLLREVGIPAVICLLPFDLHYKTQQSIRLYNTARPELDRPRLACAPWTRRPSRASRSSDFPASRAGESLPAGGPAGGPGGVGGAAPPGPGRGVPRGAPSRPSAPLVWASDRRILGGLGRPPGGRVCVLGGVEGGATPLVGTAAPRPGSASPTGLRAGLSDDSKSISQKSAKWELCNAVLQFLLAC